jgi:hypothetical protein
LVIKTLDLDPDPYQPNTDRKPAFLQRFSWCENT